MCAKSIVLQKDEAGTNWPVPTATIATYKQNLRSSREEVLVHLSDPLVLKEGGDDRASEELEKKVFEKDPRQEQIKASAQVKFQTPIKTQHVPTPERFVVQPTTPISPHLYQIDQPLQLQPLDFDGLGGYVEQEVAIPQARRSTMAEDRALLPKPFYGTADEDPAKFRRRLEFFIAYKGLVAPEDLKLFTAIMVEGTQDWLESLNPAQKNTIAAFKEAFSQRFIKPPVLKFRSACDMFHKRQSDQETVDQ